MMKLTAIKITDEGALFTAVGIFNRAEWLGSVKEMPRDDAST